MTTRGRVVILRGGVRARGVTEARVRSYHKSWPLAWGWQIGCRGGAAARACRNPAGTRTRNFPGTLGQSPARERASRAIADA